MTTTETAELLARECATALHYHGDEPLALVILKHIPLVELLNVAQAAQIVIKEHNSMQKAYERQRDTLHGEGLPYGPCQCAICTSLAALRAKLPKGASL